MEIERKFLVACLPPSLPDCPSHVIEQGYLCTSPVVRVRRQDDSFFLTYKGSGKMIREEYNLPLSAEAYRHLIEKADGFRIEKTRCVIPLASENEGLFAELDLFIAPGLFRMVEVEFPDEARARSFVPPDWFGREVTEDVRYHNSYMSRFGVPGEAEEAERTDAAEIVPAESAEGAKATKKECSCAEK